MYPLLVALAGRIASGVEPLLSPSEALEIASLPESATLDIVSLAGLARAARKPDAAFTCGIVNAKSGRCPENCAFCAQSAHYATNAPVYPLLGTDALLRRAEELAAAGVDRFGIVTSGTALSGRDLDALCESAARIVREVGIRLCASLGLLTPERAVRLREAGFTSYHHNLETSASHFPAICTTHDYAQDLETVRVARAAGFRVCSCGIFGLGETWEQRIELSGTLSELGVDSLPLNFLNPIPGTPLGSSPLLRPAEALRVVALMRLLHPAADVLVCGGRAVTFGAWQSWIFAAGANGVMTGNYLTTKGCAFAEDAEMLAVLGLREARA
ncbi:MAG TPA: biotin synthase BioB [Candidatus Bilophila faecipullorum]|uniref:Biotin synthase n=1 Tax=Candidatus Bilophila faecipullorum TaxID=2838482 RepID=A0A9D1R339_9BACT|nr:biotin synthase BioB [uncultured Bilophila sp.]HIW79598.1 biotin synthase BioB [Candidatus Bilophila faecipullorum]